MEILQSSAWYPPYDAGGTEIYVQSLVESLRDRGVSSSVVVPRHSSATPEYDYRGTRVQTYDVGEPQSIGEVRGERPHSGFDEFRAILGSFDGRIYHQHAWTRGCGLPHLLAAREAGLRTVVTVHVPGLTCLRGTMMLHGETACDGTIVDRTCGACFLQGRGMPPILAEALTALPRGLAEWSHTKPGRLMTLLSARAFASDKIRALQALIGAADRIVAVCQWLHDALQRNGVPNDKLVLCRQGLAAELLPRLAASTGMETGDGEALRILFLGRWDPVKGIEIIVDAVRSLPAEICVTLTIHAVQPNQAHEPYRSRVEALASSDSRIAVRGPVPHDELPDVLGTHDVLAVPSQWMETGPLVVLEAMAAGLHVLGSHLGGIAELVTAEVEGTLVEPGDIAAWSSAIRALVQAKRNGSLKRQPKAVRTMDTVADEMIDVYRSL